MSDRLLAALFMTVRHEIARKRVPREAYLACDGTNTLFPSCASRFTRKTNESAIATEALMSNAGYGGLP
jgi:hypothetical protein